MRRAGNPSLRERFEEKYIGEPNSGCWLWTGAASALGYGTIRNGRKAHPAHRVSYELYIGPIQEGMHVCHKCDVPSCVNPNHLFLGTHSDNMRDMFRKGRVVGPKGERNCKAKLTEEKAVAIKQSAEKTRVLMLRYGVTRSTIQHIRSGKTWRHIVCPTLAVCGH